MSEFRVEKDSMGDVKVPAKAYYGAQTQRAVEKAAKKPDLEAWRLEEKLAMVQIDDVLDDESVDLGYDEESKLCEDY